MRCARRNDEDASKREQHAPVRKRGVGRGNPLRNVMHECSLQVLGQQREIGRKRRAPDPRDHRMHALLRRRQHVQIFGDPCIDGARVWRDGCRSLGPWSQRGDGPARTSLGLVVSLRGLPSVLRLPKERLHSDVHLVRAGNLFASLEASCWLDSLRRAVARLSRCVRATRSGAKADEPLAPLSLRVTRAADPRGRRHCSGPRVSLLIPRPSSRRSRRYLRLPSS